MTKKHYEAIAEIIDNLIDKNAAAVTVWEIEARENIAHKLADYFEQENSRFDRARFLAACGVDVEIKASDLCPDCDIPFGDCHC